MSTLPPDTHTYMCVSGGKICKITENFRTHLMNDPYVITFFRIQSDITLEMTDELSSVIFRVMPDRTLKNV